jgi:hypothetical protein
MRRIRRTVAALALSVAVTAADAQLNDFQVVWVVIGEAASANKDGAARAARQLFMASDLASLALRNIKVARVEIQPQVIELSVGKQLCLSSLNIRASAADRSHIDSAPLSISVRQDHREQLALDRSNKDVCVQPTAAGEYPIRFTSLLPSRDGTTRGAQIFVHVSNAD